MARFTPTLLCRYCSPLGALHRNRHPSFSLSHFARPHLHAPPTAARAQWMGLPPRQLSSLYRRITTPRRRWGRARRLAPSVTMIRKRLQSRPWTSTRRTTAATLPVETPRMRIRRCDLPRKHPPSFAYAQPLTRIHSHILVHTRAGDSSGFCSRSPSTCSPRAMESLGWPPRMVALHHSSTSSSRTPGRPSWSSGRRDLGLLLLSIVLLTGRHRPIRRPLAVSFASAHRGTHMGRI